MKKQYMRCLFQSFLALLISFTAVAQSTSVGQWRDHLPYTSVVAVAESPDRVYAAAPGGLFALVKADNSLERLTKVNGLSDFSISTIAYNPYNSKLVIAYTDGNIDVLLKKVITNVPDIRLSTLIGNKTINSIYFVNQFAYLGTGFGIVVFDTDKMEISDTYIIGNNSTYVNVQGVTSDGQYLYAATNTNVYRAALNAPNLSNYIFWTQLTSASGRTLPTGVYNQIAYYKGAVYTCFSNYWTTGGANFRMDTVYQYTPSTGTFQVLEKNVNLTSITVNQGFLVTLHDNSAYLYDSLTPLTGALPAVLHIVPNYSFGYISANMAIKSSKDLDLYFADNYFGLVRTDYIGNAVKYYPNGPKHADCYAMTYSGGVVSMVPGAHADNWGNTYNNKGISTFSGESWTTLDYNYYTILGTDYDFMSTAIDPNNSSHIMYGSLGFGVFEFNNNVLGNIWSYNRGNSTLSSKSATDTMTYIGGMTYDTKGNLWVTDMYTKNLIQCRDAGGVWHAFDCTAAVTGAVEIGSIIAGQNGVKWAVLPRGRGILVYDDKGTLSNTNDDQTRRLTFSAGFGGLPGTEVYCLVEDANQQIWVGTDAGIAVFYNPDNMFASSGYDAQQILIQQGIHVQILMGTQTITALAVDGANRKWIGTASGGVYLMSADGTQQILNFNTGNSPLFSNTINAITINGKTGEVFFGTDKGVVSYRSTATDGDTGFNDVFAFPNPVKHDYEGPITIKGLTTGADVKITDITGTLIYQTKSLGGQAQWNGNNFKGERAHTGVYIVFCSDSDGKQTFVTKILFIN
jgi:hypothetical protein